MLVGKPFRLHQPVGSHLVITISHVSQKGNFVQVEWKTIEGAVWQSAVGPSGKVFFQVYIFLSL